MTTQKKEQLKNKLISLAKKVGITISLYLFWLGNMLLVVLLSIDNDRGMEAFLRVNALLAQLTVFFVGVWLVLFAIEHFAQYRREKGPEIVIKDPRDDRNHNNKPN
jgi:hypothetical protein